MAGVISFGRGLFGRVPVHGQKTSYKYFYRLKAGTDALSPSLLDKAFKGEL